MTLEAEAKNWDDLTSLFLNFDERNMDVATNQIYYYLSSICRQNSLKAKRLSILISPHGNMYLIEAFREGFKYYIVKYRNLDLEKFSNMQKILLEGVVGFCTSIIVHLDFLKSLDCKDLKTLSLYLASIIYASIRIRRLEEKKALLGNEK